MTLRKIVLRTSFRDLLTLFKQLLEKLIFLFSRIQQIRNRKLKERNRCKRQSRSIRQTSIKQLPDLGDSSGYDIILTLKEPQSSWQQKHVNK